ncbi:hypothetical protein AC579_5769 [Pseudocercospora musae]|uniref:Protein kinase domain-containing protein n=1 Tax=Pseudocercospora musae TaxID=113226 RepID=A0A139HAY2_9PEZI|nr:hypothetical protein AC579_5769 [Pseudocercospora musae]
MAAAAPANPLQRWQDFNVELWRAAQPRASRRGQAGVRTGAGNAWASLAPIERATVIGAVDSWRNARTRLDATLTNPSPLPNAVPNTYIRPRVLDFFERGYDVTVSRRTIARNLETIGNMVQHKSVRARLNAALNQAQTDAATWMAAIGAMRDYTRRLRDPRDSGRIGINGPTILLTPPTPTYDEDRDYLDGNLAALIERKDSLQALLNDMNTEIASRTGNVNFVLRGERVYLAENRRSLQTRVNLLTDIAEILKRWIRDVDADGGAPIDQFGQEPDVDELDDFVEHLDGIKGFEEAMRRMINCYTSRFANPPDTTGTDVEILFPSIVRCHQQHVTWFNAVNQEVDRLHVVFDGHWRDFDALDGDQQETLRLCGEKALRQREARNADLSGSWMGPMFLGAGSHGTASVWVKQDAAGRISDRVTVKDTNNQNPNYTNATGVVQPPPTMPMEAVAMLKLVDLPGSSSVVNIRNWRSKMPFATRPGYRIYMEFCSGGDLWALFTNYWPRNQNFMPEPFLWAVFDSLVTAGLLMEGAHLRDAARTIWDEIIHGDMKPDNVFISDNTSATFRGFPLAKLGDFGIATIFPKAGINPADYWRDFSGPGYRAPEMAKTYYRSANEGIGTYAPRSAANVWGVGVIMRAILHRDPWTNLWQGGRDAPPGEALIPWKPSGLTHPLEVNNYSQRLRDLIMSCLEIMPQDRPSFRQLRESILAQVGPDGADPNLARLRDADPATDVRFAAGGPPARADKYAVGLAVDDLPADALSAARFRNPPAVTSPVDVTVGGTTGTLAPSAEFQGSAAATLVQSILSRKRTFDQIT